MKEDFSPELADMSAKDLFWRKCAMDSDHRTGILFLYFAVPVALTLILSIAAAVVLTSLDDVEQEKQEAAIEQARQDALDKYVKQGINPGVARCMVAVEQEIYNLSCSDLLGNEARSNRTKNLAGE